LDAADNKEQYLPEIAGLDGNDSSLLYILISHPHLDHFGLLTQVSSKIPVGMGRAARHIIEAAAPFLPGNYSIPTTGWNYQSEQPHDIGPFRVTPYLVDHSAYDSYAFLIECEGKRIFYSGDFRTHGRKSALFKRMIKNPPQEVNTILLEGSSLGRITKDETFPSENDIENQLVQQFSETTGLALIHTSSQNIDRIVSIFRASKRTGRQLIIDLYTAVVLEATGNSSIPQSDWKGVSLYIPHYQRVKIKKLGTFDVLKRHSLNRIYGEAIQREPDKYTLLFRSLHIPDLNRLDCLNGANYIYSQWEGYWEQESFDGIKKFLLKHSIPKHSIHTSGHATPSDLQKLISAINPQKVVPIHSFFPEKYPDLFSNVEPHNDGEWWDV
jgi:ribonuclease J